VKDGIVLLGRKRPRRNRGRRSASRLRIDAAMNSRQP
jgi:hypothetical protein